MIPGIRHALIMAAGRGQRMMPLTQVLPKPMAPYQNSTLVASGIEKLRPHIANIHVTVGYKGAMLAQHLIEHGVSSVFNTDGKPNSWWLHHTLLRHVDEPIFVLTCDNVTDIDFGLLQNDYFDLGAPPCMLVPVKPVEGLEGDYIFHEQNRVVNISRTEEAPQYCSGVQVVNPSRVSKLTNDEGDFYTIWRQLIAQGMLYMSRVQPRRWFSVDTLADLERSTRQEGG